MGNYTKFHLPVTDAEQPSGAAQDPRSALNPTSTLLHQRQYRYHRHGQIAQIDDSLRGTSTYRYDALDRLTQVQGPNPEHFIHDPANNLLASAASDNEAQQQAAQTQAQGNRLTLRGDVHYTYDAHGNRSEERRGKQQCLSTHYRYNAKQQLIDVEQKKHGETQQHTHYTYDPLGRRIRKRGDSTDTTFYWSGDVLLKEIVTSIADASHSKIPENPANDNHRLEDRTYYFEPNSFKPLALDVNGQLYHYHLDHLGTPDALTDSEGNIAWSVSYQAYGNLALKHKAQVTQPLRFQGQYEDDETGLFYNRFRW